MRTGQRASPRTLRPRSLIPGAKSNQRASVACNAKHVWVSTSDKAVLVGSIEQGITTFLFSSTDAPQARAWAQAARFTAVFADSDGSLKSESGEKVGKVFMVSGAADLEHLMASLPELPPSLGSVVMDATDWKIIPAENVVAMLSSLRRQAARTACTDGAGAESGGGGRVQLLATASSAADARTLLEALQSGVDGVVIRTDCLQEVATLQRYLRDSSAQAPLQYQTATITSIQSLGSGHRVCVDMASNMVSGEGLLVGNFARGLFLVHSECEESDYINSRPFRVNAGPVHAYVLGPGGRTQYLSELRSGSEVAVVDAQGRQRTAIVGRCKIELRPLVLIEASTSDGETFSVLLQNAETVKLVGPAPDNPKGWQAFPVSDISKGSKVFVLPQHAARHTGIAVDEFILEQ